VCGRYRLSRRKQIVEEYFDTDSWSEDWHPRYNIAPTQPVPVIRQKPSEPRRVVTLMRWGLIPNWAKTLSGPLLINARSETAAATPSFGDPLRFRRCLIPADGFYEWQRKGTAKQPFCFEVNDREMFAFAGIWDGWKEPSGQWIRSCSILTTTPNVVTSAVHDRMPLILDRDNYDLWLDPGMNNVEAISELFKPYAQTMRSYPVSSRVNNVVNDDAACSTPLEMQTQSGLFQSVDSGGRFRGSY
jgi:putative SOS response-associated peptidase YedK